jgi:hypothetical protein
MGIYKKLADEIDEVDIIIAGGTLVPTLFTTYAPTNTFFHRRNSGMYYSRPTR